jgi:hypothetical protein
MFEDIIKQEKTKYIICPVSGRPRFPIDKKCSSWTKNGCRKYMIQGEFHCEVIEDGQEYS